jgi:hypothetical protein
LTSRSYLAFGDIEGKLAMLRVECTCCKRAGLHRVAKLIELYGRDGNLTDWGVAAETGLPAAQRASGARAVRPSLPGPAEGGVRKDGHRRSDTHPLACRSCNTSR